MFSASVSAFRCQECGSTVSRSLPTSVIPFALAVLVAFAAWGALLTDLGLSPLAAMALGALASGGSLLLYLWALATIHDRRQRSRACPCCGGPLEAAGGGFIESRLPTRGEVGLHLWVAGLPLMLYAVARLT